MQRRQTLRNRRAHERADKKRWRDYEQDLRERAIAHVEATIGPELGLVIGLARQDYVVGNNKQPRVYLYTRDDRLDARYLREAIEEYVRRNFASFGTVLRIEYYAFETIHVRFRYIFHL
ncbi:MAG: hypothetical protein WAV04_03960 [Candidatus Microsaccharimonas sp.]